MPGLISSCVKLDGSANGPACKGDGLMHLRGEPARSARYEAAFGGETERKNMEPSCPPLGRGLYVACGDCSDGCYGV